MMTASINNFTKTEELWNAATHGLGLALSILGFGILLAFSISTNSILIIVSTSIYTTALILMYGSSTCYHGITQKNIKKKFQTFDHASIYCLIAGTYTPITLVTLGGAWGWSIFVFNWTVAIVGIYLKFVYPGRFEKLSLLVYVLMGWIIVIAAQPLISNMSSGGIYLLVLGGLFYTFGIIFYVKQHKPFFHTIWHLFVLAGSISHYLMVLFYIV
jgi:hemolysin III